MTLRSSGSATAARYARRMTRRAVPIRSGSLLLYRELGEDEPDITRARAAGSLLLLAGAIITFFSVVFVVIAGELFSYGLCLAECDAVPRAAIYGDQYRLLFGWPLVVLALGVAARWLPALWLAFTAVCGAVAVTGLLAFLAGPWSAEPAVLGVGVPAVSPGFIGWIPAGVVLAIAGAAEWIASRQRAAGEPGR
jgi:hypothetical protein